MKAWFQHKYGYINIDAENIYITKSGNWSEVTELHEKNYKPYRFTDLKTKLKIGIYLVFLFSVVFYALLANILSGNLKLALLVGLPLLVYSAYHYIIPEFGSHFKIPFSKIIEIRIEKSVVFFEFYDANNRKTTNTFKRINTEGLNLLNEIKNARKSINKT